MLLFADRADAGRRLAARLSVLAHPDVVVLGLPRGGVPVAFEVAKALRAPLDVLVVRKLGVPFQPELAMGAVGEGGVTVLNERMITATGVTADQLAEVERRERDTVEQRVRELRRGTAPASLVGKTAVIVDDGIATGSTARAACRIARAHGATRIVLAAPVAPPDRVQDLAQDADEVVIAETPSPFYAIGEFYLDFSQTSDREVSELLARAAAIAAPGTGTDPDPAPRDDDVRIPAGDAILAGHLTVPPGAGAVVVFVHGSGSSRLSPRNRFVASALNEAGLGTLLFDLLTADEEGDRAKVFDIALLASRLEEATHWLRAQPGLGHLPLGYFGASTGAAAALWAAADQATSGGRPVAAVVSRGGRPDLAAARLPGVRAPTLLIVGGDDDLVLDLNRRAAALLECDARLAVVPGATHLFEEPGALQSAAELARDWFLTQLKPPTSAS